MDLYERNYAHLARLLQNEPASLSFATSYRYRAPGKGIMDLVVERLSDRPEGIELSLVHYFEQEGDLCKDPEMTLLVRPAKDGRRGTVEALTFEQSIPPVYQQVYPTRATVRPLLKKQLNAFLATWLRNLLEQGHRLESTRGE